MIAGFENFLKWHAAWVETMDQARAFVAFWCDDESDLDLILAVEQAYEVTHS
ncbi:hypothetical protein KGG85_gp39 [Streptomyces phage Tefunt]|uniref:Uncharacterized protein n=1 Tax=Streptomyces phage Tefunt TaxID=2041209 RepID=A0A291LHX7_9CAUD|nr:hypothetical protein KGG85_gp39 [Streptomyces phage Tefunt]ATI18979.1 hypothetical protein SEA_TEFUNT_39 [Streptomyces phage Tefunt]AXH70243.1 hypothetical protein SEA_HAIZUM_39 [Streptomyces phage Haizum]QAY15780.1 hypothetical protein SEA_NISHIKIGOI_39 [Streptomyces phage Nishikigoi]